MRPNNQQIINSYLALLSNLSADSKLEIISRLSDSLKSKKKINNKSLKELFGAFKSEKSADEIISEIKESHIFNRTIEPL